MPRTVVHSWQVTLSANQDQYHGSESLLMFSCRNRNAEPLVGIHMSVWDAHDRNHWAIGKASRRPRMDRFGKFVLALFSLSPPFHDAQFQREKNIAIKLAVCSSCYKGIIIYSKTRAMRNNARACWSCINIYAMVRLVEKETETDKVAGKITNGFSHTYRYIANFLRRCN